MMRTNIEIDDKLMQQAMRASIARTRKETAETALQLVVRLCAQESMCGFRGKIEWEGSLAESRLSRLPV